MIYAHTERLILRSWKPEDLHVFTAMNRDPRVMRYFPAPLTDAETETFYNLIQEEFDNKGWGLYAVELKSTGEFIGYVGLHEIGFRSHFTPGIEIGWRLAPDHHNRGYATEAAKAVLKLAADAGIRRLYSFTAKLNIPSQRVMQKIGMIQAPGFTHPALSPASPLAPHLLYQIDLMDAR